MKPFKWIYGLVCFLISVHCLFAAHTLENDKLLVTVHANGAISLQDKQNRTTWGYELPGWVTLIQNGRERTFSLQDSETRITSANDTLSILFNGLADIQNDSFAMHIQLSLNSDFLDIEIKSVASSFPLAKIEYPAHILNVESGHEDGYIVVPNLQGILIPSRYDAGFMRYGQNIWDMIADKEHVWTFESGMLNMPWFGASLQASSMLATVMTPSDCQLRVIGNAVIGDKGVRVNSHQAQQPGTRLSSLTPIWLAGRQQLSYPRKLRLELVDNGYVGMAKRYREYSKDSGRFVTMQEKIARNPEYEKIIGAPDVKIYCDINRLNDPYFKAWSEPVLNGYSRVMTTFDQVGDIADELNALGVEKCMILLGGWNRMGYDREHVDMWPPSERAGGIAGLKRACERARQHGYIFALHDNYNDFYPDAPSYDEKYIIRKRDGSIRLGGIWDGGLCHVMCSAVQGQFLKRNLGLVLDSVPLNGYYFDVVTSVSPYECYAPNHPNTRKQDLDHRYDLFYHVRDKGLVVGGERGCDWSMPAAAFYEGMQGGGTGYHRGIAYRTGLTVPLFYLVYHDCVVGYWQHGTPHGREDHANHVLFDLLCAQPSSWSIVYDQWHDLKPMIKETYELLGRLHERTAFQPMTDHQFLTTDCKVQQTTFGDGTTVIVNYGITTFEKGAMSIPPKGFCLTLTSEQPLVGMVDRRIHYIKSRH